MEAGTGEAGAALQELFELADAVCLVDRAFRVRLVNAAHERITGVPRAEAVGRPVSELWPELGVPTSRSGHAVRRAMTERVALEVDEYVADRQRWFQLRLRPARNGEDLALFFTDITTHKAFETERAVSEERLRLFVQHAPAAIALLDRDLRFLAHSRRFVTDFGLSRESLVGLAHDEVMPAVPPHWRELYLRALEGESLRADEERLVLGDGAVEWVHLEVVPWLDSSFTVGGIVIFTEHLTRFKQAEAALAEQLERTQRAEEALRNAQKMEAVGRLAGGIAHDFNNVLTVIVAGADSIAAELDEGDPLREEAAEIQKACERATSLTRQLLAISRKQIFAPRPVDVNVHLRGLEPMLRRLVGEEVTLTLGLHEGLPPSRVDPGQLEQVILNLVINARDAMPSGGTLTVETKEFELDEAARARHPAAKPGPHLCIVVSDTGVGMPKDVQEHIFEPFFTTKAFGKGTGLGLAMVYGIVEQHGGTVSLSSEPGKGSRFCVSFPCDAGPLAHEPPSPPPPRRSTTPNVETVLVVDDEPQVRSSVAAMLQRAGFQVLVAGAGDEALRVVEQHHGVIHLVLTDVKMPGVSGPTLAQHVRERRPDTRIVFMSGYTGENEGLLASNQDLISKPFSSDALISRLRTALDRGLSGNSPPVDLI